MQESLLLVVVSVIVIVAAVYGLAYWAYRARSDRSAYFGLYLLIAFPSTLMLVSSLVTLWLGDQRLASVLLLISIGLGLPMLKPFRQLLAKVTPIDPDSPTDMAGLAVLLGLAGSLLGLTVTVPTPTSLEGVSPNIPELLLQAAVFVLVAYFTVGWRIVRTFGEATARLGITRPTWETLAAAAGFTVLAFLTAIAVNVIALFVQPELAESMNALTEDLTANFQNPVGALILGISAGVGEEALFRGALQPRYGIVLTSIVFALLHAPQYGLNLAVLGLFAVSILLGLARNYFGTTTAMIAHAAYNAIQVLLVIYVV
ncbi:MAG: CPBP family intramembrane metalloprotease [Chloroflexia bacterium]|nr:CPBP family intramembrane metalloprotease [Chloroflexia bacterium]MDQ3412402.1 CPBP family intramembrane metalloprotease [Chloroflexota bacterium]